MKRILAIAMLMVSMCAMAQNAKTSKTFAGLKGYSRVTVNGNIDVVFSDSFRDSVYMEAEPQILEKLIIEVKGPQLTASFRGLSTEQQSLQKRPKLFLSPEFLAKFSVDGSSQVTFAPEAKFIKLSLLLEGDAHIAGTRFSTQDFTVKLRGNSTFSGYLNSADAHIDADDIARVHFTGGNVAHFTVWASGRSHIDLQKVINIRQSRFAAYSGATIRAEAKGSVQAVAADNSLVWVGLNAELLDANLSSNATLEVKGKVSQFRLKMTDNSSLRNAELANPVSAEITLRDNVNCRLGCAGSVSVRCSGNASMTLTRCGGLLKYNVSGASKLSMPREAQVSSAVVKDQAAVKYN